MRDGFYGIASAWDLANATHHAGYAKSAAWMFSHARADGILPQACPPLNGSAAPAPQPATTASAEQPGVQPSFPDPAGTCDYGNTVCNQTVGAKDCILDLGLILTISNAFLSSMLCGVSFVFGAIRC